MQRWLMVVALALGLISSSAQAGSAYESWRATIIAGGDTLNIFMDPGMYNVAAGKFDSWYDSQHGAQWVCMNCAPHDWGIAEAFSYNAQQMRKEQNPQYLSDHVFLFLNIERRGTGQAPLKWRTSATDSVIVTLRDGRRLPTNPPKQLDVQEERVARKGESFVQACAQAKLLLGGQDLLTIEQINARRKNPAYRDARYNEFTMFCTVKDPPKNFLELIAGVRVYFNGQPIDLQQSNATLVGAR